MNDTEEPIFISNNDIKELNEIVEDLRNSVKDLESNNKSLCIKLYTCCAIFKRITDNTDRRVPNFLVYKSFILYKIICYFIQTRIKKNMEPEYYSIVVENLINFPLWCRDYQKINMISHIAVFPQEFLNIINYFQCIAVKSHTLV